MRPVIFGVLAFVLGLGGSTGVGVLTTPVRLTAADSLVIARADTTHAAHPQEGSATHAATTATHAAAPPVAAPTPEHVEAPPATVAASTASSPAPTVTHVAAAAEGGTAAPRAPDMPDADSYKQVGSILLNMKPVEAAKILGYLNDDQVEGLVRSMSPRNAAGVFSQLPPERAAALSRRLLIPSKEVRP